ncbi:putative ATP-dependent RNA helicase DDX20 [Gastrophryne carolinensis]
MAAHALGFRPRTGDVLQGSEGAQDFRSLLLSQPVLEGLEAAGFSKPSPIQSKAIPLGRCGLDLIVQAKSGTGKTCVFSTVALDSLILENTSTQILILAPTREIAVQIHSVITTIGSRMEGLECHVFIGGTALQQDKAKLKKCHIAVGSPGRIKQLIEIGYLNTASVRLFVLDEADKLLEVGSFQEQINWIYSSLPANKQMLAVSATYPESLAKALIKYMREPTFVRLNVADPSLIGIRQFYKVVNSHPLPHKIFEEKVQHLQELFSKVPFNQALVFSNLHSRAQHLADILTSKGFPAVCISGSMNQNQRLDAMAKLKQYHCRVLISTDLTSRGIDAEKVNLVINLDVPHDWETYMHRIGRAGRFGTYGLSVSYCCRGEEENLMMSIAQKCNLHLLPLPDPVPNELMMEACDWDVEITPQKTTSEHKTNTKNVSLELEGDIQNDIVDINPYGEHFKNKPVSTDDDLIKPKKAARKKITEKANSEGLSNLENSSIPRKQNDTNKPKRMVASKRMESKIQDPLDNSLPKIPSLSSFKRPAPCTSSFAELVEDYEQFIKEGLEKHVEVIHIYTGSGSNTESQISESLEKDNHNVEMPSDGTSTPVSCDLSGNSGVESDNSSSSSLSESENSEKSDCSNGRLRSMELSSSCPDLFTERTEESAVSQIKVNDFTMSVEQVQPSLVTAIAQPYAEDPVASNAIKPIKRGKKSSNVSRRDLCQETQDDLYQLDYRNPGGFPYGTVSYGDYWRSYYQAWQTYHSAVSSSYYRNVYKCSNWMSAYHMHSVYLHEMLKP